MENEVVIRPAEPEDINTIGFLAHQIWPKAYEGILSEGQIRYMLQLMYSPKSLWQQMVEQHHSFLIAEWGEEPAGFASFSATSYEGVYKLHKLYVRTDIQGRGLGRLLIDAVIEEIRPLNASALRLGVNRDNKARSFYEKLGFVVIREEDTDIGSGYVMTDYIMEKKIADC